MIGFAARYHDRLDAVFGIIGWLKVIARSVAITVVGPGVHFRKLNIHLAVCYKTGRSGH